MDDAALQTVYRSVVIAKLQYASTVWWGGVTNTSDRQRVNKQINVYWTLTAFNKGWITHTYNVAQHMQLLPMI